MERVMKRRSYFTTPTRGTPVIHRAAFNFPSFGFANRVSAGNLSANETNVRWKNISSGSFIKLTGRQAADPAQILVITPLHPRPFDISAPLSLSTFPSANIYQAPECSASIIEYLSPVLDRGPENDRLFSASSRDLEQTRAMTIR